jgi:hypothetical protein
VPEQIKLREPGKPPAALPKVAAGQAVVTYENGQLTIEAKNAPLIDVLRAVCSQIGAELDAPPEAREPILMTLGPAPARVVLAALLDGSQLHYAMREAAGDPGALESVIVFPKTNDSKTLGPVAQDGVSQRKVSSTNAPSTGTGSEPPSDAKQLMGELLTQAQAELANSGGAAVIELGGDENSADGDRKVDVATMLRQVEAQMMTIGDAVATDANSPQTGQQAGAVVPGGPVAIPRRRRH